METAAPKQRSPWFYVLLGCGGFALLSCLGVGALFGFGVFKAKESVAGLFDRSKAAQRATAMLGAIPEGYVATGSLSMFGLMELATLVKGTELPDGGFEEVEREFVFVNAMASDANKDTKAYFKAAPGQEPAPTDRTMVQAKEVIKRGQFTIDSQKMYYVVSRGALDLGQPRSEARAQEIRLNAAVLFDCPGERLHLGVWSMADPQPNESAKNIDLSGTVGDETQLVPFLKQMTPCGA